MAGRGSPQAPAGRQAWVSKHRGAALAAKATFEALDSAALKMQLAHLFAGATVRTSRYDFKEGKSHPSGGNESTLGPSEVLLLEGIHGLNPELVGDAVPPNAVFRIFVTRPPRSHSITPACSRRTTYG